MLRRHEDGHSCVLISMAFPMKTIACTLLILMSLTSIAQKTRPLYDLRPIHFGFALTGNTAKMKIVSSENFLNQDTIANIKSISQPGLGFGGLISARMGDHFNARLMFGIQFATRQLEYSLDNNKTILVKDIESTYFELPLLIKYKSERLKNVRFYGITGFTYRFDFTSDLETDRSPTKPIVALYPNTLSYDIGCGLDVYFEYFKFSPEIRLSNGLGDARVEDPFLFSRGLDRISPKLLQFSIIFEP